MTKGGEGFNTLVATVRTLCSATWIGRDIGDSLVRQVLRTCYIKCPPLWDSLLPGLSLDV